MKTKTKWGMLLSIVMILCLTLSVFGMAGCSEDPEEEPDATVTLNRTDLELDLHETFTLQATVENGTGTVTWTSTDTGVATVTDGLVASVSEGTATITASLGNASASCSVIVVNSHTAPVIQIDRRETAVIPDGETVLNASVLYKGNAVSNVTYSWTIADDAEDDVVRLTPENAACTVKGLKFGRTVVTVSAVVYGIPLAVSAEVTCVNDKVDFTVNGLEPSEFGYAVDLALIDADEHHKELSPEISVTENGSAVDLANVEWSSDDENVATAADGKITAVSLGTAVVKAEYNGGGVYFEVNVEAVEVYAETKVVIEYVKDGKFVLANEIEGVLRSAEMDGIDILKSFDRETGTAEVDFSLIKGYGEKDITLSTDKATYHATAEVYTMVIRTADDLDRMLSVADEVEPDGDGGKAAMNGYFVLGNDIDYVNDDGSERVYTALDNCYINDWSAPFRGTFDGRGYNIDHFQTGFVSENVGSGLFPCLTGTIKNVSFTNGIHGGKHGFVTSSLGGTIENVYVHLLDQKEYGTAWYQASAVFSTYSNLGVSKIINCFSKIDKCDTNTWPIACFTAHAEHLSGVYSVGGNYETPVWIYDGAAAQGSYGGYSNYEKFVEAGHDLSSWSTDFWKIVDGIPYPKNLEFVKDVRVENVVIEYDKDGRFTFGDDVQGTVNSVKIGGVEILKSFDPVSREAEVDLDKIGGYGENEMVIMTASEGGVTTRYAATAEVYTMVIRTADDLDRMQSVADEVATDTNEYAAMDGYFVLGNDIDYVNEDGSDRIYYPLDNCHVDGWSAPFRGTFDGRGYNIDHFRVGQKEHATGSGLFTVNLGTIKNVSFTNAIHEGMHGFITSSNGGTIENVYVHLLSQKEYGTGWSQKSAVFWTYATLWSAEMKNCFVKIDSCDPNTWVVVTNFDAQNRLDGVFTVGGNYETAIDAAGTQPQGPYGGYADYEKFVEAGHDLSGWSTDFWQIVDGIPYPKNLDFPSANA